jgi:hypothetical protein
MGKTIAILNYSSSEVLIFDLPNDIETDDEVIDYVRLEKDIDLTECEYMIGDNITVKNENA